MPNCSGTRATSGQVLDMVGIARWKCPTFKYPLPNRSGSRIQSKKPPIF
jgi:transposase-like protein